MRRTNSDKGRLDMDITLKLQFTLTLRHRYILNMKSTITRPFIGASSNFWKLQGMKAVVNPLVWGGGGFLKSFRMLS